MAYARLLTMAAATFLPIGIFLLLVSLFATNRIAALLVHGATGIKTVYATLLCSAVFGLLPHRRFVYRLTSRLAGASLKFDAWLSTVPLRSLPLVIVALSAGSLFFELALIRWQSGLFSVFAFYKNFILLACFCGLGIGYALANRRPLLLPLCLPALVLNVFAMLVLHYGGNDFTHLLFGLVPVYEEATVSGVAGVTKGSGPLAAVLANLPVYSLLAGSFLLNTLVTIPVSQLCGRVMGRLPPLPSYGFNVIGSICGVLALFALSWLWIGPLVWFGLVAVLVAWFLFAANHGWKTGLICLALLLFILSFPTEPLIQNIYSPYQLIQKAAEPNGLMRILAAGTYYQKVFDLSSETASRDHDSKLRRIVGYYELPFLTARSLQTVAIVGAGSGNDIAAALRYHAGAVDAAEIDPVIRNLGEMFHPEHPYQDPRVTSYIGDARAFFRSTNKKYDLIVYGVLDSHILVSQGSNVRIDSFVYTQEGLNDAFRLLKPGGLMSLSFALTNELMGHKVYALLKNLPMAGHPAAVLSSYDAKSTTTFMVRKCAEIDLPVEFMTSHNLVDRTQSYARAADMKLDLPTDNWPFFYMDYKMYPASYVVSLLLVMILAVALTRSFLPGRKWNPSMTPFFFLGAGFMLIETKAITELGLLFGNTWWVVGITVISVLVMGFLANVAVMRFRQRSVVLPYCLLLGTIGLGFWIARHGGLNMGAPGSRVVLALLLVSPLAFSGIVFSVLLEDRDDVSGALACNLSGAMLGGLLEYNSMEFGFAALYLIALALYACAWLTTRIAQRSEIPLFAG
jgi:spermidine synthase